MNPFVRPPVVIAFALAAVQISASAAPSFSCRPLVDESPSAEAQDIGASALNNHKQVVGVGFGAWQGSQSLGPMLWGRDRIGHRNQDASSWFNDLNDDGVIVGNVMGDDGRRHPTMWKAGQQIDLGALPAANGIGSATAVNNKGVAVGLSEIWRDDQTQPVIKGTLWRNGKVFRLPGLAEKDETSARDINDHGVVVGRSGDGFQPVVWKAGVPTALPNPSGANFSVVEAINNQGVSVGLSGHATGGRGTAWQDLVPIDLGALPNYFNTEANHINDAGAVVGWAYSNYPTQPTAVYWASIHEAPQDLNHLVKGGCVDAFGIQRELNSAARINSKGVILAHSFPYTTPKSPRTVFVLTPR